MNAALLFVCLLPAVFPNMSNAAALCPFMNEATATGILGGPVEVQVTVTEKDKGDATCEFRRKTDDSSLSLNIQVKTMHDWRVEFPPFVAQCGHRSEPIRGIGNEAVACTGDADDHKRYDQILSRVRERSLSVRVTTLSSQLNAGTLRQKAFQSADLVSGNLF